MSGVVHLVAKDHKHRDGPVLLARLARPSAQNQCLPCTKGRLHPQWVTSATRKPQRPAVSAAMPLSWDFVLHWFAPFAGVDRHQPEQRSFAQLRSFFRSDEVDTRRQGCCTPLLYWCPKAWPRSQAKMRR
jgi:hypothetical protein